MTQPRHIDGLVAARDLELTDEETAELETLARNADVDTRGWWEQDLQATVHDRSGGDS